MSLLLFYWHIQRTGDNQEHKIERHTKMTLHILWSLTSRSIPSLVQNRNQSSIISCLSDSREDTGQASLCGFKLMTTNFIIQNYEHAWGPTRGQLGNNQEHKIERHTKTTLHILWSPTSRSIPSLVQNRNQSSIISCLSHSREDTVQASLCGYKLMTTNFIIQNYEHA